MIKNLEKVEITINKEMGYGKEKAIYSERFSLNNLKGIFKSFMNALREEWSMTMDGTDPYELWLNIQYDEENEELYDEEIKKAEKEMFAKGYKEVLKNMENILKKERGYSLNCKYIDEYNDKYEYEEYPTFEWEGDYKINLENLTVEILEEDK